MYPRPRSLAHRQLLQMSAFGLLVLAYVSNGSVHAVEASQLVQAFDTQIKPFVSTYCLDCHNSEKAKGDLDLSGIVDSADFSILLLYYGEINPLFGDFDGSGMIDAGDAAVMLLYFGPVTWP